jgi:hypothetical protein
MATAALDTANPLLLILDVSEEPSEPVLELDEIVRVTSWIRTVIARKIENCGKSGDPVIDFSCPAEDETDVTYLRKLDGEIAVLHTLASSSDANIRSLRAQYTKVLVMSAWEGDHSCRSHIDHLLRGSRVLGEIFLS